MSSDIRPITEDEVDEFRVKLLRGFGADVKDDDEDGRRRFLDIMPLERTRAAFDGGEIVGTLGDFPLQLTVPGGFLSMAGTTMITVQATHRRRGLLRRMIDAHLHAARDAGEPVAGLWASESSIYGRFGYGHASSRYSMELDSKAVSLRDQAFSGSLRIVDVESARDILPAIFDGVAASRPGMFARSPELWRWRTFHDPSDQRDGASAIRVVIRSGADGDDGYAIYRQKEKWEEFHSVGSITVREVIALSSSAHSDLWNFLTNVDLFPKVTYWNLPLDDPLPWKVRDPRRVMRSVWDALWLHVLDVPTAMSARVYAHDGVARFGVSDAYFPGCDGTYEIEVVDGVAQCSKVSGEAEVTLTAEALGATYLGGRRLGPAAAAGRIDGDPAAIRALDEFLSWHQAPWCQEIF